MDSRIGVIGGQPPLHTLSGLSLPHPPYPTTVQLDNEHYVVVDDFPLVDVDSEISVLRASLGLQGLMSETPEPFAGSAENDIVAD